MYYDLQMVRINGSLVGAVLGGIFYGLYLLVEGCSNDSVFEIPHLAAAC